MPLNRDAAIDYASKHWNRVTDDDKFWTSDEEISVAAKRKSLKAPAAEGWEAFFVSNDDGGRKRRVAPDGERHRRAEADADRDLGPARRLHALRFALPDPPRHRVDRDAARQ